MAGSLRPGEEKNGMDENRLLSVDWKFDPGAEQPCYELQCTDPEYAELHVSLPAESVTERAARAQLIDKAFQKAMDMGLDVSRLRFHV